MVVHQARSPSGSDLFFISFHKIFSNIFRFWPPASTRRDADHIGDRITEQLRLPILSELREQKNSPCSGRARRISTWYEAASPRDMCSCANELNYV